MLPRYARTIAPLLPKSVTPVASHPLFETLEARLHEKLQQDPAFLDNMKLQRHLAHRSSLVAKTNFIVLDTPADIPKHTLRSLPPKNMLTAVQVKRAARFINRLLDAILTNK